MKLNIIEKVPEGFCSLNANEIHDLLGGPTLIHLKEGRGKPIFISTLLHGNEHSGFIIVQKLLKQREGQSESELRPLLIFIGNTISAQQNLRHLPEQPDFNRVWSGGDSPMAKIAEQVKNYAREQDLLCSIDIHNNTGKNPFYGCVNKIEDSFFFLAKFFFDRIMYFTEPHEVQSVAFAEFCPSVVLEIGQSGDPEGIEVLYQKILDLMKLDEIPNSIDRDELNVFYTIGRMRFSHQASLDFEYNNNSSNDFSFVDHIDEHNFTAIKEGEVFGYVKNLEGFCVEDHKMRDIFDEYFEIKDGKLIVKKFFIPAMITKDIVVIKDDCFGYIMEKCRL